VTQLGGSGWSMGCERKLPQMTPDSAAQAPVGLLQWAVKAVLLEVTALVRMHTEPMYEPDPFSAEAPFLSADWPRS
jgi:hypothetical protein